MSKKRQTPVTGSSGMNCLILINVFKHFSEYPFSISSTKISSSAFEWRALTVQYSWLLFSLQAFSTLCHDALLHSRTMGLKAIFTDHSLFGFADLSSIITNKFLEFSLSDISHVICVSNTRYYAFIPYCQKLLREKQLQELKIGVFFSRLRSL